ncbi:hypothetical protein Pcinc_024085 [Petrolisthes cinctipes]|uniref:CCHC-type domain-containing protein n=1 Tax=Petrolisthes cinctipes TaxID=88211 RepID=A0AAE1FAK3_PETCI|nr:hypothetical protein Pcinc_024085 [Petrolisthes cinctipes]
MEEDRKSYKVSTDPPLPHAGDEEVTGGDVGEREGEVVGDTTPTYRERRFSNFSLPHPLPAFQQKLSPNTDKTVDEVLNELQEHIKNSRKETIQRRDLLNCKLKQGESFSDFYVRIRHIAEEIDVCPGKSVTCEETQLKMVILMGVRDEELVQKLLTLDTTLSLQDIVKTCHVYEATRSTTSVKRALPSQVNVVSSYKKNKQKHQSSVLQQSLSPVATGRNCGHEHDKGKCPTADKTCSNCGRRGHWQRSPACPATNAQCHTCKRMGHYDRCCRSSKRSAPQVNSKQDRDSSSHSKSSQNMNCQPVGSSKKTPTLTTVSITYRGITANRIQVQTSQ